MLCLEPRDFRSGMRLHLATELCPVDLTSDCDEHSDFNLVQPPGAVNTIPSSPRGTANEIHPVWILSPRLRNFVHCALASGTADQPFIEQMPGCSPAASAA